MKKTIRIKSRFSIFDFFVYVIIDIILIYLFSALIINFDFNHITTPIVCIIGAGIIYSHLFIMYKINCISKLEISYDVINIYAKKGKKIYTNIIEKKNIKYFKVNINCNYDNKEEQYKSTCSFDVLLKDEDKSLSFDSTIQLFECDNNFIYRLIDISNKIPAFELNFSSNNKNLEKRIENYKTRSLLKTDRSL